MKVKIKRLNDRAIVPKYAHDGDAGMDLVATSYYYDTSIKCHVYGTGLAVEIPYGYVGLIFPRSSNRKTDCYMCNHVGVIDSGYRGELMCSFKSRINTPCDKDKRPYNIEDRIAQLIIIPYPEIEFDEVRELSNSDRGINGHGSTGN